MPAFFETGFSVREVPWHRLGNILDDYPGSWAQARKLAGLEWDPVDSPVYDVDQLYADGRATVNVIDGWKRISRSDNGHTLSIVMNGYEPIDHGVMGEIFEAIMNASDGDIRYETAGSLMDGKRVWALARLGDALEIAGDPSPMQPYLALLNSHDGSSALRVITTNVRIVCMNTWHAAEVDAERRGSSYAFKHTKNWRDRVDDAKKALTTTRRQIEHTVAAAEELLRIKVNTAQRRKFIEDFAVHRVIKNTVARRTWTKRELEERMNQPRVQRSLTATMDLLTGLLDGRTCQGISDTAWGLIQAAGEFADHHRATTGGDEALFTRTMLTEREPLKNAAVRLAVEAARS